MSGIGFIKNNRGFISKDNISNFSDCLKLRGNFETNVSLSFSLLSMFSLGRSNSFDFLLSLISLFLNVKNDHF